MAEWARGKHKRLQKVGTQVDCKQFYRLLEGMSRIHKRPQRVELH
jgi:hypothetical protein